MDESAQETLILTFKAVIEDVISDKRKNPKNAKTLDEFQARINLGLHVELEFILWTNLIAEDGKYSLNKGMLEEFDLEIIADPEDMMYFINGLQWSGYKRFDWSVVGESACADSWGRALKLRDQWRNPLTIFS